MKNDQYGAHDVKRICEHKLGINFKARGRRSKEYNGWFWLDGRKEARITIPKGRKNLPPGTYSSMARQLKLRVGDFDDLLDCPVTLERYREILRAQQQTH